MKHRPGSIEEAAAFLLESDSSSKFHIARLNSIEKTLNEAKNNRKILSTKVAKMEKAVIALKDNIANLDEKINTYSMLFKNVKADPNFKLSDHAK